ncbi:MAG: 4Fe-4S dicluster domain-containing protein [Nitrospirae bacterium]|nr:MAG: 4Fe-4S dicluster domain-containing protein [Nitrospirota bacterium]
MPAAKKQRGKIIIDRELCKGCRYCIISCPEKALSTEKAFNEIGYFPAFFEHPERCTGCAVCAKMCPDIAIEVWRE